MNDDESRPGSAFDERLGEEGGVSALDWLAHQSRYLFAAARADGRRVLDLACGTGYGSAILARHGAREVTGIDLSESALEEGRRLFAHPRVHFLQGDAFDPPVSGLFDLVVSFETIEHVPAPERLLDVLAGLVTPSGTLICSTPNRAVSNPGTTKLDPPQNPHHLVELDRREFIGELRARFDDVRVYGQIHSLPLRTIRPQFLRKVEERLAHATTWPVRLPLAPLYMVAVCHGPRGERDNGRTGS